MKAQKITLKKNLQKMRKNNSIDLSLFLLIAKIGKTRGLNGEFFLRSFAEQNENLFSFKKFFFLNSSVMEELDFEYIKSSNANIIAKIKGFDDIDTIKLFGQKEIFILRSELPELAKNEAYWFELKGMNVMNLEGDSLGKVCGINNYGASDILEVKPKGSSANIILIPYIKNRTVISIDRIKNIILVDWQEDY